jgi:hypothetical protein
MAQTRGGISAKQIQRETGVTYKCAWRMGKQIRSMLGEDFAPFGGIVEADKSYFGGSEKNKHFSQKRSLAKGRSTKTKTAVFGLAQRGGMLEARTVVDTKTRTLVPIMLANGRRDAEVHTDEYWAYRPLRQYGYTHGAVPHKAGIYVDGDVHTNTIDGFWSQAKNGIRGVYHAVSAKYVQRYLDEYAFRYNHRNDIRPMFLSFLSLAASPSQKQGE